MVIIASREGQLANRLWHASVFIANALANKYKIVHLFFDDYYPLFSERLNRTDHPLIIAGKKNKLWLNILRYIFRFMIRISRRTGWKKFSFCELILHEGYEMQKESYDLQSQDFITKAKSKFVICSGWLFSDSANMQKYKKLLLDIWTPNSQFIKNINAYHDRYSRGNDILVGVHIRRGDYKKFNDGIWFFELSDYYEKMKEMASLEEFAGKKIAYVICSNEKDICFDKAENFDILYEPRHFIEDLYLLAKCNYILGPPSSFSMWASFYGSVPLYMLRDINSPMEHTKFAVYN